MVEERSEQPEPTVAEEDNNTPPNPPNKGDSYWLPNLLKSPKTCILDLIILDGNASDEFKELSRDLLELIVACACQEQHFLDFYSYSDGKTLQTKEIEVHWNVVIDTIASSLNCGDNSFYNLSYIDSLVSCLVYLTANLGWTATKPGALPKKILFQLVKSLCELIVDFQCGKGSTTTSSVMGVSITRNVILILNHLVAEMNSFKMRNWEKCFMEVGEEEWIKCFVVLWGSRDVLVRAGVTQLFAGLANSPLLAINLMNTINKQSLWHLTFAVLTSRTEASVVKENAAFLLSSFLRHTDSNNTLAVSLTPKTYKNPIQGLLEEFNFFQSLLSTLPKLHSHNKSESTDETHAVTVTPSLVRSYTVLLMRLLKLEEEWISFNLQDFGLVKLFFRCILNPCMAHINTTKTLSKYCEILEMNTAICGLLAHLAEIDKSHLGTILHTKDCLMVLMTLLNPKLYHTNFCQLIYLRNKLWSQIFNLLAVLSQGCTEEELRLLSEAISDGGKEPFVETMCEALKSVTYKELQNSALHSLSALLIAESQCNFPNGRDSDLCLHQVLDTTRTSSRLNTAHGNFDTDLQRVQDVGINDNSNLLMAGAEICKILINQFELYSLPASNEFPGKPSVIISSLAAILCTSQEAKNYAFTMEFHTTIIKQLKQSCLRLSLESVDCLKRISEKKRICPVLNELHEIIGLITNFMVGDLRVKNEFAVLGLSDLIHKLWVWFLLSKSQQEDVFKLLATFTTNCPLACQSLALTSSIAGSGLRRNPTKISLLYAVTEVIDSEMNHISRTHNLDILELSFIILKNCCSVIDCRTLLAKSSLFNSISRLHPAITKRQKPWDKVELIWLDFLEVFTLYVEGQSISAKFEDVFDLILTLCSCNRDANRVAALQVLRNITFYCSNRARLLNSGSFLNLLKTKLATGPKEDKFVIVSMMWALAANNQKSKIIFKAAQLDIQLQQMIKQNELSVEDVDGEQMKVMRYVLSILRDGERN